MLMVVLLPTAGVTRMPPLWMVLVPPDRTMVRPSLPEPLNRMLLVVPLATVVVAAVTSVWLPLAHVLATYAWAGVVVVTGNGKSTPLTTVAQVIAPLVCVSPLLTGWMETTAQPPRMLLVLVLATVMLLVPVWETTALNEAPPLRVIWPADRLNVPAVPMVVERVDIPAFRVIPARLWLTVWLA